MNPIEEEEFKKVIEEACVQLLQWLDQELTLIDLLILKEYEMN